MIKISTDPNPPYLNLSEGSIPPYLEIINRDKLTNVLEKQAKSLISIQWDTKFDLQLEKEDEYYELMMSCFKLKHYDNPKHADYIYMFNRTYHNKIKIINNDKMIIPLLLSAKFGIEQDINIRNNSLKIIYCRLWNLIYDKNLGSLNKSFDNDKNHISDPKHLLTKYKHPLELFEKYYIDALVRKSRCTWISYPDMGIAGLIRMFKNMWLRTTQLFK